MMYLCCSLFILQCGTSSWCEKGCSRECGKGVTYDNIIKWRTKFWGDYPTAKERRAKIRNALKEARRVYLLHSATAEVINPKLFPGQFCFKVGGMRKRFRQYCGYGRRQWIQEQGLGE